MEVRVLGFEDGKGRVGRKDVANLLGAVKEKLVCLGQRLGWGGGVGGGFFYGIGERRMREFILMVFRASTGL